MRSSFHENRFNISYNTSYKVIFLFFVNILFINFNIKFISDILVYIIFFFFIRFIFFMP